jgi:hypothetical protein
MSKKGCLVVPFCGCALQRVDVPVLIPEDSEVSMRICCASMLVLARVKAVGTARSGLYATPNVLWGRPLEHVTPAHQ